MVSADCASASTGVALNFLLVLVPFSLFCYQAASVVVPRRDAIEVARKQARPRCQRFAEYILSCCTCCSEKQSNHAVALKPGFCISLLLNVALFLRRRFLPMKERDAAAEAREKSCCRRCLRGVRYVLCCGACSSVASRSMLRIGAAAYSSADCMPFRLRPVSRSLIHQLDELFDEVQTALRESDDEVLSDPLIEAVLKEMNRALRRELLDEDPSRIDLQELVVDLVHRVLALPAIATDSARIGLKLAALPKWLAKLLASSAGDISTKVLRRLRVELWADANSRLATILRLLVSDLIAFNNLRRIKWWPTKLLVLNFAVYVTLHFSLRFMCSIITSSDDLDDIALVFKGVFNVGLFLAAAGIQLLIPLCVLVVMSKRLFATLYIHSRKSLSEFMARSIVVDFIKDAITIAEEELLLQLNFLFRKPVQAAFSAFGGSAKVVAILQQEWPPLIYDVFESIAPASEVKLPKRWLPKGQRFDQLEQIRTVPSRWDGQRRVGLHKMKLAAAAEDLFAAAGDEARLKLAMHAWKRQTCHAKKAKR